MPRFFLGLCASSLWSEGILRGMSWVSGSLVLASFNKALMVLRLVMDF